MTHIRQLLSDTLISLTSYSPRKRKKKSVLSAIISLSLLYKKNVDVSGNVSDAMHLSCRFFEKLYKICIIENKNVIFNINKHEIASYLYVKIINHCRNNCFSFLSYLIVRVDYIELHFFPNYFSRFCFSYMWVILQ